jgi:hypothetical protein
MVLPRPEVRVGDVGELHGVENADVGAPSQGAGRECDRPRQALEPTPHLADSSGGL